MREMDLLVHLEFPPFALRHRGRGPFADPVHGEYGSALKGRGIKRARRVAEMVLGEDEALLPVDAALQILQLLQDRAALEELVLHPHGKRGAEGGEAFRREREIGLEQPLELEERLVVERDVVDFRGPRAGGLQARLDGVMREARVVLLAREALLLRRRRDLAVDDQRRRGVVVIGGDAEDLHL